MTVATAANIPAKSLILLVGGPGRCGTSTAHQGLAERCGEKGTIGRPKELPALPAPEQLSQHDLPAPSPQLRCDRCGTPFSPRRGSGGSRQRFCSSECRLDFHTQRQRMDRRAAYIAPTTLPATGQPGNDETSPATPLSPRCTRGKPGSSTSPTASGLNSSSP